MKIILDTNIWISFLIGHQVSLMRQMLTDVRFDVVVCQQLIDEIVNVANRQKFKRWIKPNDIQDLLSLAESVEAKYIVSGDADLTDLKQYKATQILKLADFKELMCY